MNISLQIQKLNSDKIYILKAIFKEILKPIINKKNYNLIWANGIVSIQDKFNNDIPSNEFENIYNLVNQFTSEIFPFSYPHNALWEVLSDVMSSGKYSNNTGLQKF